MKPTKGQLKDPQWWKDNVDDKYDFAYTTGPEWDGIQSCKNTVEFADSQGEIDSENHLCIEEKWWVLLCERPKESQFIPETGTWCECDYPSKWTKVFVIGPNSESYTVIELQCGNTIAVGSIIEFRPLKTEREEFIEKASETPFCGMENIQSHYGDMFDNGFRFVEGK